MQYDFLSENVLWGIENNVPIKTKKFSEDSSIKPPGKLIMLWGEVLQDNARKSLMGFGVSNYVVFYNYLISVNHFPNIFSACMMCHNTFFIL